MKHLYITYITLLFFTFSLKGQETAVVFWDFSNPSAFFSKTGGTYSGSGSYWLGATMEKVDGTQTAKAPKEEGTKYSAKFVQGLGINSGKVHMSVAFKSWKLTADTGNNIQFKLRDADNKSIATLKLEENKVNNTPDGKARIIGNVWKNDTDGQQYQGGHFGGSSLTYSTPKNIGITIDFDNNSYEFWVDSPTSGANFSYNFGSRSGSIPTSLATATIDHLQIVTIVSVGSGDNFVIDQIKISTGDYVNTLSFDGVLDQSFNLYPNPAQDFIVIGNANVDDNLDIFNVVGKRVKSTHIESNNQQIDISDLKTGVYFARSNQQEAIKIIKR